MKYGRKRSMRRSPFGRVEVPEVDRARVRQDGEELVRTSTRYEAICPTCVHTVHVGHDADCPDRETIILREAAS